jgi:hypothetical protein
MGPGRPPQHRQHSPTHCTSPLSASMLQRRNAPTTYTQTHTSQSSNVYWSRMVLLGEGGGGARCEQNSTTQPTHRFAASTRRPASQRTFVPHVSWGMGGGAMPAAALDSANRSRAAFSSSLLRQPRGGTQPSGGVAHSQGVGWHTAKVWHTGVGWREAIWFISPLDSVNR